MDYTRRTPVVVFLLTAVLLICSATAEATVIQFAATNLPDTTAGQDLWRYDYTVSGRSFLQDQFFDIYFDPLLYRTLAVLSTPGPQWEAIILLQPNPANIPPFDRGMFDAAALVNSPPLAGTFSVSFVFLGAGSPNSQPFDIFAMSGANAVLLESGVTTPAGSAIPEPASFLYIATGMGIAAIRFCRSGRVSAAA